YVHRAIIDERDRPGVDPGAVQNRLRDAAAPAPGILDGDLVEALPVAPPHHETIPRSGNARCDREAPAPAPEPQYGLEAEAVHPRRRAGVPGPASSADVRRVRVDVSRHHVRLHLVTLDVGGCAGVIDR